MRVRKKDKENVIKVGAFVTLLCMVLMIMVVSIGKENSLFNPKIEIRARVPNVSNLKEGSYVELKGIRIGTVIGIRIISDEEVEILMSVLQEETKWIKQDSRVSISTAGLVGDKYVEVYKGTKESPSFNPEKDVLYSEAAVGFTEIMNKGDSIAKITERILVKLDAVMTKIDDGQMLVSTFTNLNRAASNMESVTAELKKAQMGQMVSNVNASMANMSRATASIDRVLTRVEKGPGTMNSLIYDDSLHDDLRALLGGAQRNKVIKYYIRESIKNSEDRKPAE
jgi:phospholipid/cholesterol/gamma-HCH transport system substrate-binding protein